MGSRNHVRRAALKAGHIGAQIDMLERARAACPWGNQPAPQTGGLTPITLDDQIRFQRWRLRLVRRCLTARKGKVRRWLAAALSALTPEEQASIGGDVSGIRPAAFVAVVAAEIYMIALGQHPGQRGEV